MGKVKIKIERDKFIVALSAMVFLVIMFSLQLFYNLMDIGHLTDDMENRNQINSYMKIKIISYFVNVLFIISFMVYVSLIRSKIEAGRVFIVFWFLLFLSMAIVPYVYRLANATGFKIGMNIFISIPSLILCWVIIDLGLALRRKRYITRMNRVLGGKERSPIEY